MAKVPCKQVLQGALAEGAGKGRRAYNYVSGIRILPPIPL